MNLSTRAQAGAGPDVLTVGFVISGGSKQVLVRGIGPTLGTAPFNLPGVLPDPVLTVVDGSGAVVATNDDWNAGDLAAMSAVGAFPLPAASKDAAIVTTLAPGNYTAQVTGASNTTGLAIVEVYEIGAPGAKLANLSARALVGTGANVMIPGIVVGPGTGTRRLLVRAAGPALGAFGLAGTLPDPTITLTNAATGATVATNDDWSVAVGSTTASETALTAAFQRAGAFAFARGSKDSALLVDVAPGNYGIQVSGAASSSGTATTGLALVEVYDVTPPLAIFSVTPAQGPIAGGSEITLSGRGFSGATVLLDDKPVTPLAQSDSEIRLRMPAHDNGYAVVTVRSGANTTATEFLYVPPRLEDLPPGYITTIAGVGNHIRVEQPATLSRIAPWGIAQGPNGDIYFAQVTTPTNFIFRVSGDGILHRVAGNTRPYIGNRNDGVPALDAYLGTYPRSVALDASGNIYVTTGSPHIRRIDAATGLINTIAGNGTRGFSGDGGPAIAALLTESTHVTIAPDGALYFLDDNTRVRKITTDGIITTVAGNGTIGESGDGGPALNAQLNSPMQDGGAIAVDRDGNLFILETEGARVRKVDGRTGIITTFASQDARGRAFRAPTSVAIDTAGNVYVAAKGSSSITKFDRDGRLVEEWGDGRSGFSEDGTLGKEARLGSPMSQGMVIAPNGDIIWADEQPARIRKINLATGKLETIAGMAPNMIGVPGRAVGAAFNSPAGDLAFLPSGDLLFADSNYVFRITASGLITAFGGTGMFGGAIEGRSPSETNLSSIMALETNAGGEVFFAEKQIIRRIDVNGIAHRFAGNAYGFSGDGGRALDAFLCQPHDFTFDRDGNTFIADTNNNRIRRVDARTGIITTVVGTGPSNGYENYGRGAFGGDGGPAVEARLNSPTGIVVLDDGTMLISDHGNHVLRKVAADGTISTVSNWPAGDPTKMVRGSGQSIFAHAGDKIYRIDGNQFTRIAGKGINGFSGDGGPALNAALAPGGSEQAWGLAIDAEGNLFIHDAGNRRIRAVRFGAVLAPTGATIELRANDSTLRALVRDAAGHPAPGVRVDFSAPSDGASAILSRAFAITDASGVATISYGSNGVRGDYSVTARPLTASTAATIALTNPGNDALADRALARDDARTRRRRDEWHN